MKISIITVALNAEEFIGDCIRSVIGQTYGDIEYIIVDGASTDGTLGVISRYQQKIARVISEKDQGIYDAMNKGIAAATGEVIGILNADDFFADPGVLSAVALEFKNEQTDVVYGNLYFVNRQNTEDIMRRWVSKPFNRMGMEWGWMPAHPTFYARKSCFKNWGVYKLNLNSSADYELMLRFMYLNKANSKFLNRVMVMMRMGGVSTKSVNNRLLALWNDFKAMRENGITFAWIKIFVKPLRKIVQYL